MNFEITEYTFSPFKLEIEYSFDDYCYTLLCDFNWLDDEYNGSYLDFEIQPLHGTFFHSTNDETGTIKITPEYTEFIKEKVKEFRDNSLWLYTEALERQQYLDRNDYNYWADYGI